MVAVDWSGRRQGAGAHTWRAEVRGGELVALQSGAGAAALGTHLVELAAQEPLLAVGLDFAFSFPAWFLASLGVAGGPELGRWRSSAGRRGSLTARSPSGAAGPAGSGPIWTGVPTSA